MGDRESIGDLLQHYRRYLMLLAITQLDHRVQPRVSPSDVVQVTLLKASRRFGQFNGQSEKEFLAWLRQILATSLARFVEQHVRASKRDVRKEFSIEQFEADLESSTAAVSSVLRAPGESPSAAVRRREEAALLAERLAQLPRIYRDVLVLRNMHGLPFEEVAARLDRSPGAARMLWLRAIEKLRAIYQRAEQDDL
jgi:RNA polymerase sigma-70 factor (ECF subfamily)